MIEWTKLIVLMSRCQDCPAVRRGGRRDHDGRRYDTVARVPAEHRARRSREPAASGQLLAADTLAADGAWPADTADRQTVVPGRRYVLSVRVRLEAWTVSRYVNQHTHRAVAD